jgi:hypothetical protein
VKNFAIYQQLIAALQAEKAAARKAYFKDNGTLKGFN